ncbi:MAG: class I SAM-dependent methyltransferase [Bacteroidota bacterium]
MRQLHQGWLGSLTGARVLELGAGSGSPMSVWLAKTSAEYTAIDLSKPRLDELQATLAGNGVTDASLYATDFLSDDFDQRGFDIVYARSVLHHFRHVEPMLDKLSGCMAPGGMVVSFDPLQTWWGARLFRNCYRPFQTDADWEYPFTKKTFQAIESRFAIEAVQGYFGRSKWALPIAMVAPNSIARSIALRLHRSDQQALTSVNIIPTCLQASLLLRKNGAPQLGVVA